MFICGSSSLGREDSIKSPNLTSKRSKRSTSFKTANKNPYADRGLDKFYALLANLDDKRQKIYKEMGAEEISFVQFVYNHESDQVRPIVVKVKDKKPLDKRTDVNLVKHVVNASKNNEGNNITSKGSKIEAASKDEEKDKWCPLGCNGSIRVEKYVRHPYNQLVVMVVLILMFLAISGRSFAVLCMSIIWYLIPSLVNERKPERKKNYARKQSKKKMNRAVNEGSASPKSVLNGLTDR